MKNILTKCFEAMAISRLSTWYSRRPELRVGGPLAMIVLSALFCGVHISSVQASPSVLWAGTCGSSNIVRVVFDEAVSSDASNPANYTLDQGRCIASAAQTSDALTVLLLVSPALQAGVDYLLTIQNIRDLATPPNVLSNESVACHSHYYPGVTWDAYITTSGALPNFNSLTPVGSGLAKAFTLGMETWDKWFAVRFRAYLDVTSPGTYTFYTSSDDGSMVWIGNAPVVNNAGAHAMREASGTTNLASGLYPVTVGFFQGVLAYGLTVSWEGPGISKQPIPPEVLYNTQAPYNIPLPTAPSSVVVNALAATQARLGWTESATSPQGYLIERSRNLNAWAAIAVVPASATNYDDTGLEPATLYYYRISALNEAGCVPSAASFAATPSVLSKAPPVILAQPQSQRVNEGSFVIFQVGASATPPLTYQWSKDGTSIANATNDIYIIAAVAPGDEGAYSVTVASAETNIASDSALLRVNRVVQGTTLVWDADLSTVGAQDGNGTWLNGGNGWYASSGDTGWFDNNVAAFGISATTNCTVALANRVAPSGIVFNATGGGSYTIAGTGVIDTANTPSITADADGVISAVLSGSNGFVKLGNGTLTLSNANTYDGVALVLAGTLRLGSATALGTVAAGTTIAPGATLDVNGQDLSRVNEIVSVSGVGSGGNGAVINSRSSEGWLNSLTLTGDTTISTANPLSIGSTIGQNGTLKLGGFTLTKSGLGQCVLNGIKMTGTGNISVNQGTLRLTAGYHGPEENTSLSGNGSLTVNQGATLAMNPWDSSLALTMPIILNGGALLCDWPTEALSIASPITLTAASFFNLNDTANYNVSFTGVISGTSGFTKQGGNLMRLYATNTYTGPTIVSGGTLLVNGWLSTNKVSVENGATLGGAGVISGPVVVQAGGMLAPGTNGNGGLTLRNTVNLAGTVLVNVSKTATNLTNGRIIGVSTLSYGGALVVTRYLGPCPSPPVTS